MLGEGYIMRPYRQVSLVKGESTKVILNAKNVSPKILALYRGSLCA